MAARYEAHAAEMAARYEEQLQFTREFMRRNEVAFLEFRREVNDLIDESRAQRGALLTLIDEMRGGGASPATP
jgi:hypothetical protein